VTLTYKQIEELWERIQEQKFAWFRYTYSRGSW
jgi:hypothetical protein